MAAHGRRIGPAGLQRRPGPATVAAWAAATCLALAMSVAALHRPASDRLADLRVYAGAVSGLRAHHSLYDFVTGNGAPFTYPPFAGLLLTPLAYLPEWATGVVWTAATVAVVFAVAAIAARYATARYATARYATAPWAGTQSAAVRYPDTRHTDTQSAARYPDTQSAGARWVGARYADGRRSAHRSATAGLLAVVLFASAPVSSNLRFGQVSVALAALVIVDFLPLGAGRWCGILTGIASAVKLTPAIFVPLLWFGGRRRAAVVAGMTALIATAGAWLVLPADSRRYWLREVWDVNRLGHISTGGNQSFNGALLRLGVPDQPRTVLMLLVAAAVGITALARATRAARGGDWLTAAVVVGSASVVVSPVSWTHHEIWLVLAVLLPVSPRPAAAWLWRLAVAAVMILPVTAADRLVAGPAGSLLGDGRLVLAIVISCLVPLAGAGAGAGAGIGAGGGTGEWTDGGLPGRPAGGQAADPVGRAGESVPPA